MPHAPIVKIRLKLSHGIIISKFRETLRIENPVRMLKYYKAVRKNHLPIPLRQPVFRAKVASYVEAYAGAARRRIHFVTVPHRRPYGDGPGASTFERTYPNIPAQQKL